MDVVDVAGPIAAILLLVRPNAVVGMTAAIIIADVTHNRWIRTHYVQPAAYIATLFRDPFALSQVAFLIFVLATNAICARFSAAIRLSAPSMASSREVAGPPPKGITSKHQIRTRWPGLGPECFPPPAH